MITDPAGDVTTADRAATVPDGHVDLRTVALRTHDANVVVHVTDSQLVAHRQGVWRVMFTGARKRFVVTADLGMWVNAGNTTSGRPFRAGIVGQPATEVSGTFDYVESRITVTVPLAVLRMKRGTALSAFAADSQETFVNGAPPPIPAGTIGVVDSAASTKRYIVGAAC